MKQSVLACDTETGGLDFREDSLLLVQICTDDGRVYMVRRPNHKSVKLLTLMANDILTWIFHHAAFDLRFLKAGTGFIPRGPVECTKTLMKIVHPQLKSGLGSALRDVKKVNLNKSINHDGWNAEKLSKRQLEYAAGDVLELHGLLKQLRQDAHWGDIPIYKKAMTAIVAIADLEVQGYTDLFQYEQNKYDLNVSQRNWWRTKELHDIEVVYHGG